MSQPLLPIAYTVVILPMASNLSFFQILIPTEGSAQICTRTVMTLCTRAKCLQSTSGAAEDTSLMPQHDPLCLACLYRSKFQILLILLKFENIPSQNVSPNLVLVV